MALGEQGKNRIITKTFENPAKHFSSRAGLVSSFVWFDFILKFIYQRKLGSKRLHLFFQRGCSSFFFVSFFFCKKLGKEKSPNLLFSRGSLARQLAQATRPCWKQQRTAPTPPHSHPHIAFSSFSLNHQATPSVLGVLQGQNLISFCTTWSCFSHPRPSEAPI